MGLTFKENCPDLRNAGISKVITILKKYNSKIDLYDPLIKDVDIKKFIKKPLKKLNKGKYDAIIVAVSHDQFKKIELNIFLN